ncbi:putative zinc-binding metallopeptidase [Thalassotalea insulae]|uniref:putative zinc-binding metallopeptidase n=1 Tax=Thalassotalea insulae TaxID=2056778 RepID=UPI0024E15622|nr:putative zinc-binding metallopeptidase [Thalassotalea insulae]
MSAPITEQLLPIYSEYYHVTFTSDARKIVPSHWPISYQILRENDRKKLDNYLNIFEQEFSKMPAELITLSNLKTVIFVKELYVGEQYRAAVPDYINEVLYYDINAKNEGYARRVIHHEFYHMLEQQLFGSAYYKDPNWQNLNVANFAYGDGGHNARSSNVSLFTNPYPGFVNGYAMSGLEEDKAEIWAVLWLDQYWQKTYPMLKHDCILADKVNMLITQLSEFAPSINSNYFHSRFNPYLLKNNFRCNQ